MNKKLLLMLILLAVAQMGYSQCNPSAANIYSFTYNGNNYEIVKENLDWVNAAACAVTRGGILAEIDSQAEQDAIFSAMNSAGIVASNTVAPDGGGASYLWIGGNDMTTEGVWVWDGNNDGTSVQFWQGDYNGSPVGGLYNNWGNEPDNYGNQDGLGFAFTNWPLGVAGEWNDVAVTNSLYFVIEYSGSTSIHEINTTTFSVYPNPSDGRFEIISEGLQFAENCEVEVYNVQGEKIYQSTITENKTDIDLGNPTSGIYFMKIFDGQAVHTEKIVIQ